MNICQLDVCGTQTFSYFCSPLRLLCWQNNPWYSLWLCLQENTDYISNFRSFGNLQNGFFQKHYASMSCCQLTYNYVANYSPCALYSDFEKWSTDGHPCTVQTECTCQRKCARQTITEHAKTLYYTWKYNVHCLIPANNLVTVVKLRLNHQFKSVQGPHDKVLNGHCDTSPTTGKALQHHHHWHTRRQLSSHV